MTIDKKIDQVSTGKMKSYNLIRGHHFPECLFANDARLFQHIDREDDSEKLQQCCYNLYAWAELQKTGC